MSHPREELTTMPTVRACSLRRTPLSLDFDFEGPPGVVTLEIEATIGTVAFEAVKYSGQPVGPLPAKEITFTIAAGITHLSVVYAFSDPVGGRGVLREQCVNRTRLIDVRAGEPAVLYRIHASVAAPVTS
jgi:hypothetical protein